MAENGFFFTTPYIRREEICKHADNFRKRYWAQEEFPVDLHRDIEHVNRNVSLKNLLEFGKSLEMPLPNLLRDFDKVG